MESIAVLPAVEAFGSAESLAKNAGEVTKELGVEDSVVAYAAKVPGSSVDVEAASSQGGTRGVQLVEARPSPRNMVS